MANPNTATTSPVRLDGLTNGQSYQVQGRSYALIDPAGPDVLANRVYGDWGPLSSVFTPTNQLITFNDSDVFTDTEVFG